MRLLATFALEYDEERLEAFRQELVDAGEKLYVEEKLAANTEPVTVKHWPGSWEEWDSFFDVSDLMDPRAGVIQRAELLEVRRGPEAWTPKPETSFVRELMGPAIVIAIVLFLVVTIVLGWLS